MVLLGTTDEKGPHLKCGLKNLKSYLLCGDNPEQKPHPQTLSAHRHLHHPQCLLKTASSKNTKHSSFFVFVLLRTSFQH